MDCRRTGTPRERGRAHEEDAVTGLDRRIVRLERMVLPRGNEADPAWDAVLEALSTDELRALLAHVNGADVTGARAE